MNGTLSYEETRKLTDKILRIVYGTEVPLEIVERRRVTSAIDQLAPAPTKVRDEVVRVNLLVVNPATMRELSRHMGTEVGLGRHLGRPDSLFGVRVAYDESMAFGEVLPAYAVFPQT